MSNARRRLRDPRPAAPLGDTPRLPEIVTLVAAHWLYHAGEINAILAIRRGEAWEHMEEVEENHISTVGHQMRPPWMTDDEWTRFVREHM